MLNINANNFAFILECIDKNIIFLQTDIEGIIEDISDQFCYISGYKASELIGQKCSILSSGFHTEQFYDNLWSTIKSAQRWQGEIQNSTKNGKFYWLDMKINPIVDGGNDIIGYISVSNEITELKNSYKKLSNIISNTHDIIYTLNEDGTFDFVSPSWTNLLGHELDAVINHSFVPFVHPEDVSICQEYFKKVLSQNLEKNESIVYRVFHKEGTICYHQSKASILKESPSSYKYLAIASDITESIYQREDLEEKNLALEKLVRIDYLTSLYNRVRIDEILKSKLSKFRRYGANFGVIMLDIDFFKDVNDTYGHQVGDEILISISKILEEHSRKSDSVGRWGGEEFLIISPYIDEKSLFTQAEYLRAIVEKHQFSIGYKTISLGLSIVKEKDEVHTLIKRADEALYKAKKSGRNNVCIG